MLTNSILLNSSVISWVGLMSHKQSMLTDMAIPQASAGELCLVSGLSLLGFQPEHVCPEPTFCPVKFPSEVSGGNLIGATENHEWLLPLPFLSLQAHNPHTLPCSFLAFSVLPGWLIAAASNRETYAERKCSAVFFLYLIYLIKMWLIHTSAIRRVCMYHERGRCR